MWQYRHANFSVYQTPALHDNYIYLIVPERSELLIVVDPADAVVVDEAARKVGRKPTHIFNTHHHADHTGANLALKQRFGCTVVGSAYDQTRIPGLDIAVSESEPPDTGNLAWQVMFLPGHTRGHIAFLVGDALFCGDVLFGAGCGRLFEGTADQMWTSLQRLAALPGQTKVYCAHEYTLTNLAFAQHISPHDQWLEQRINHDSEQRKRGLPTIPSQISVEKESNPFLRPLHSDFCTHYATNHQIDPDTLTVFAHLRHKRNSW